MHADMLAQGEYLRAVDLIALGAQTLTLKAVRIEELESLDPKKKGKKRPKGIVEFAAGKPWVINVTNKEILKQLFGDGRCGKAGPAGHKDGGKCVQTDHWIGHRIILGAGRVPFGSDTTDGILVMGSPMLTAPLSVSVSLPQRKARVYVLTSTGKPATNTSAPQRQPDPVREPGDDMDPLTGEHAPPPSE